jgi:hypothetical protein
MTAHKDLGLLSLVIGDTPGKSDSQSKFHLLYWFKSHGAFTPDSRLLLALLFESVSTLEALPFAPSKSESSILTPKF